MYNIGYKIKKLREKNNLSQIEFANKLNIGIQSMSHYETGKRIVPLDILDKIAKFFNVPIESFFSDGDSYIPFNKEQVVKSIPIVSNVSAGLGEWGTDDILDYLTLPESICKNCDFGTIIKGDSMEPKILDGDIALIQKRDQLFNGEIGIFRYKEMFYCKKYRYSDLTKEVVLKSLNEKYDPIVISLKETNDFKVLGKVVGSYDYDF